MLTETNIWTFIDLVARNMLAAFHFLATFQQSTNLQHSTIAGIVAWFWGDDYYLLIYITCILTPFSGVPILCLIPLHPAFTLVGGAWNNDSSPFKVEQLPPFLLCSFLIAFSVMFISHRILIASLILHARRIDPPKLILTTNATPAHN